MLAACGIHYNFDFELVVRYLDGKYLARWRDIEATEGAVKGLILKLDFKHMRQILQHDCPAKLNWEEPAENKKVFMQ